MLSVSGLKHFYYVRDFTDMRCKHGRVLSIIRERLHREPSDGDVFIVLSRDRRIVGCSPTTTVPTACSRRGSCPVTGS